MSDKISTGSVSTTLTDMERICGASVIRAITMILLICFIWSIFSNVFTTMYTPQSYITPSEGVTYVPVECFSNEKGFDDIEMSPNIFKNRPLTSPLNSNGAPINMFTGFAKKYVIPSQRKAIVEVYAQLPKINGNIFKFTERTPAVMYEAVLRLSNGQYAYMPLQMDKDGIHKLNFTSANDEQYSLISNSKEIYILKVADNERVIILHGSF
jgi:hypothetical protein